MVRFGCIRHAVTSWNLEKRIQGREDIALCGQGKQQAKQLASILKNKGFDMILSSPMMRARQTATIISNINHIPIEYDINLREQDFGQWEGRTLKEIQFQNPGEIKNQEILGWDFCPPSGESRKKVLSRSFLALEETAARWDGKNILVVCHKSVIKIIINKVMNRTFLPGEKTVLKDNYLHYLKWGDSLQIEQLNHTRLS